MVINHGGQKLLCTYHNTKNFEQIYQNQLFQIYVLAVLLSIPKWITSQNIDDISSKKWTNFFLKFEQNNLGQTKSFELDLLFWLGGNMLVINKFSCLASLPLFSWSIFIRAVRDHMICYNLNWPKIKLWVHYFVFSCALDHILKS